MSADTATPRPTPKFLPAGAGHYSARRCDVRKGGWLCGKPASNRRAGVVMCPACELEAKA